MILVANITNKLVHALSNRLHIKWLIVFGARQERRTHMHTNCCVLRTADLEEKSVRLWCIQFLCIYLYTENLFVGYATSCTYVTGISRFWRAKWSTKMSSWMKREYRSFSACSWSVWTIAPERQQKRKATHQCRIIMWPKRRCRYSFQGKRQAQTEVTWAKGPIYSCRQENFKAASRLSSTYYI